MHESESESESEVAQSTPTLRDPMDCSPPGSSIHGIFQAGVLEWGAIAFSAQVALVVKKPPANAGDIMNCKFEPWVREFPWRRAGQLLQYSCLENPMDREAWQATVHEVPVSPTPTQGSILSLQGGYNKPPYQSATLGPAFPHDSSKQNRKVPSLHRHMLSIWPQFPSLQLPRWC